MQITFKTNDTITVASATIKNITTEESGRQTEH